MGSSLNYHVGIFEQWWWGRGLWLLWSGVLQLNGFLEDIDIIIIRPFYLGLWSCHNTGRLCVVGVCVCVCVCVSHNVIYRSNKLAIKQLTIEGGKKERCSQKDEAHASLLVTGDTCAASLSVSSSLEISSSICVGTSPAFAWDSNCNATESAAKNFFGLSSSSNINPRCKEHLCKC